MQNRQKVKFLALQRMLTYLYVYNWSPQCYYILKGEENLYDQNKNYVIWEKGQFYQESVELGKIF